MSGVTIFALLAALFGGGFAIASCQSGSETGGVTIVTETRSGHTSTNGLIPYDARDLTLTLQTGELTVTVGTAP